MFKNKSFYHQHIRKAVVAFGSLFNNISITRQTSDGSSTQTVAVPLSYGPKQKMIARIQEAPSFEEGRSTFQITLPRLGFEVVSLKYDSSRKLSVLQPVRYVTEEGVRGTFISTPYNMEVKLGIFAKNQDDGLQIIEQILPFFNPDFNVTVQELPELNIQRDIQFILDDIHYDASYEGEMGKRTLIMWDLSFTVKINLFGFVNDVGLIRRVIQNIYIDSTLPTITNTSTGTKITTEVVPFEADPDSDWTFVQEFDAIEDEE